MHQKSDFRNSDQSSTNENQDDRIIMDLIEKRRLQQEALRKIISSIDTPVTGGSENSHLTTAKTKKGKK